jgi:hypothetical protein
MEWKKYPENKPNKIRQGFFIVRGRSANTNGLSSTYTNLSTVLWDGFQFGNDNKSETVGFYFKDVGMIVDEYLEID